MEKLKQTFYFRLFYQKQKNVSIFNKKIGRKRKD